MSRRLLLIVSAVLALAAGVYFMPRVNPYFAARVKLSRQAAQSVVEASLKQQDLDAAGFLHDAIFLYDGSGLDYLMETFGVAPVLKAGQENRLPLCWWQFDYYRNVPKDQQRETIQVRVSPSGKLLAFNHVLPDSAAGDSLSADVALTLVQSKLQTWPDVRFADFKLEQSSSFQRAKRTDHKLVFVRNGAELGKGSEILEAWVAGARVSGVFRWFRDPSDFLRTSGVVSSSNILINTVSVGVYIALLFASLIAFLRKYHEGEIGVKTGLWLGGIVFFTLILQTINIWDRLAFGTNFGAVSQLYNKLILAGVQIFFGYNFIALMTLASWTVGEQFLRADRPKLLSGVDSLFNRQFITRNIGREVPVGFGFGLIIFGAIQLMNYGLIHGLGALPRLSEGASAGFDTVLPFGGMLVGMVMTVLFDELVFRLFLITSLRRLMKSTPLAIVLAALAYGFFLIFFNDTYGFRPSYLSLIPSVTIGLVLGFVFWRYGLLASMAASVVWTVANQIGPLLGSPAPFFLGNALAGIVALGGVLVVGLIGGWRGKEFAYTPEGEPAHIRRIKERVRLQKELEIARRVQLGLLPKIQPKVNGFDIAGSCIPALEVGGDYFDFVHLKGDNLGIAIGDVSGKGVPAAIYMTLTKGILQSYAEEELSPKQVLTKVNHLMYRTIERSWYVSMFYAVLDPRRRLLRFARAGHNPAIVFRSGESGSRFLQTAGIGLGLEVGEIFTKTLVEGELQLSPGDTLILYTDGFTEAMNSQLEEFGDRRFLDLLHRHNDGSAEQLVQHAFAEARDFAGEHPQHDDMTIVVLKAK